MNVKEAHPIRLQTSLESLSTTSVVVMLVQEML